MNIKSVRFSKYLSSVFYILVVLNLIFGSWYVLHSDILFSADIARDFLIYDEIKEKIIILIGGRTSSGLYHGPLWWYINYPAYYVGDGNPLVVGWYWIVLISASLVGSFYMAKKLFGVLAAYLFTLLLSQTYVFHSYGLINPHGAMLIMPFFFYLIIQYLNTKRPLYLILFVIVIGLIIQFEMAVGIPLFLLSVPIILYSTIRNKNLNHMLYLGGVLLFISNYILFDLHHGFIILNKIKEYIFPEVQPKNITVWTLVVDRIGSMFNRMEFLRDNSFNKNVIVSIAFTAFLWLQIRNRKFTTIYFLFIYFYLGYFILSLINKGYMLPYYLYPLFPMVFLIFTSFVNSKFKRFFILIFTVIYLLNLYTVFGHIHNFQRFTGKSDVSWQAVYRVANNAFKGREKEFGYFVYSPDAFAYAPQYAVKYASKQHPEVKSAYFTKKHVTYLLSAPPPPDNPYMQDDWWIKTKLKINNPPEEIIHGSSPYTLKKFILSQTEIDIPYDPTIDVGLHFR